MSKIRIVAAVALNALAVGALIEYIKVHRQEQIKRAQIKANTKAEVDAILSATDVTLDNIAKGKYNDGNFQQLWDDYEFEKMTQLINRSR